MPTEPAGPPPAEPSEPEGDLAAALAQVAESQPTDAAPAPEPGATEPPAEPAPTPTDAPTEPSPAPAAEDDSKLLNFYDKHFGDTAGKKYRNDAEFLSGIYHLRQLVARRDDDAAYGRQLRQHEAAFSEFLQSRQQPAPTAPQEITRDQVERWQTAVERDGENAPLEARQGLQQVRDRILEMALKGDTWPEKAAEAARQEVLQQRSAENDLALVNAFEQKHKEWIYQGGQIGGVENLTPDGQQLLRYAALIQHQYRLPRAAALDYAFTKLYTERTAQQQTAQAPQTAAPVKPSAQHQPAVAAPAGGYTDAQYQDDLNKLDLEEHLKKLISQNALQ